LPGYNRGMDPPIYLDHNATAPLFPEVADAIREAALRYPGNPSSQHRWGRAARQALEEARDALAEMLGAKVGEDRILFTSGGTEANNLALFGLAASQQPAAQPGRAIISPMEHSSVAAAAERLRLRGWRVDRPHISTQGVASVPCFRALLEDSEQEAVDLVSLTLAHSETGVLQPVAELATILAHSPRPPKFHTDAVQAVGKRHIDFRMLGIDALVCTAHKFHGPLGIGLLILRSGTTLEPNLWGGFQQEGLRPGTETVALAIGMELALRLSLQDLEAEQARLAGLRDHLEELLRRGHPDLVVLGSGAERLGHTLNVSFPGLDRQTLAMALDLEGVAVSTGSACASGSSEPSPVHVEMGLSERVLQGAIRLSLGRNTTRSEIVSAADRMLLICKRLAR
jgi:cysteine desulfurase